MPTNTDSEGAQKPAPPASWVPDPYAYVGRVPPGYERGKKGYVRFPESAAYRNIAYHRQVAYHYIYRTHRAAYPQRFGAYVVHHRDGDPLNNVPENLEITTEAAHHAEHPGLEMDPLVGYAAMGEGWETRR
jgi:hypothetical protein